MQPRPVRSRPACRPTWNRQTSHVRRQRGGGRRSVTRAHLRHLFLRSAAMTGQDTRTSAMARPPPELIRPTLPPAACCRTTRSRRRPAPGLHVCPDGTRVRHAIRSLHSDTGAAVIHPADERSGMDSKRLSEEFFDGPHRQEHPTWVTDERGEVIALVERHGAVILRVDDDSD